MVRLIATPTCVIGRNERWGGHGWKQQIFEQGADTSDEGAEIRFSGYYKCKMSPKNSYSLSDGGLVFHIEGL